MKILSSIVVKFAGPTNCRGARWIAKSARWADRVTTAYDYSTGTAGNVRAAAEAYLSRFGIDAEITGIVEIDGSSYAVAFG